MRRRRIKPLLARLRIAVSDAAHLANVYAGGMLNRANPVLPHLPLRCEHAAYTAGRDWLDAIWRTVYAIF